MPSTGNAAWDVVVAFVGLVVAVLSGAAVVKGGWRTAKDADKARDSPLPPTWAEMWQRMDELNSRVGSLENEVRTIRDVWRGWYRDLDERWEHHRAQDRPPKPPPT